MKYYDDVPTKQSLRNAKEEFEDHVGYRGILCAIVRVDYTDVTKGAYLPVGHTQEQYEEFLNNIDLPYTPHGEQMLYGTIWYTDGTWALRGVNTKWVSHRDHNHFWVDHKPTTSPEIPEDLRGV